MRYRIFPNPKRSAIMTVPTPVPGGKFRGLGWEQTEPDLFLPTVGERWTRLGSSPRRGSTGTAFMESIRSLQLYVRSFLSKTGFIHAGDGSVNRLRRSDRDPRAEFPPLPTKPEGQSTFISHQSLNPTAFARDSTIR